jgi:16S rRNA (uracil1498-N3)-methyltransferase
MYNFFVDKTEFSSSTITITGKDFNHIKNVLRFKVGDRFCVSADGRCNLCEIIEFTLESVLLKVVEHDFMDTSLPIWVTLFQGLPKQDKLELIIQKAVELGVDKIVPVEMKRSVVKIEEKKKDAKTERFNAISESAAKQCKRQVVPEVIPPQSFINAVSIAKEFDHVLVPYECENGMQGTLGALKEIKPNDKVAVFIGPEGGFDDKEIATLKEMGAKTISLGKRILRTETASITALSMLMLYAEINL